MTRDGDICSNAPFCLMCGFSVCRDLEVKLAQAVRDLSRMTDDLKSAGLALSDAPGLLLMRESTTHSEAGTIALRLRRRPCIPPAALLECLSQRSHLRANVPKVRCTSLQGASIADAQPVSYQARVLGMRVSLCAAEDRLESLQKAEEKAKSGLHSAIAKLEAQKAEAEEAKQKLASLADGSQGNEGDGCQAGAGPG